MKYKIMLEEKEFNCLEQEKCLSVCIRYKDKNEVVCDRYQIDTLVNLLKLPDYVVIKYITNTKAVLLCENFMIEVALSPLWIVQRVNISTGAIDILTYSYDFLKCKQAVDNQKIFYGLPQFEDEESCTFVAERISGKGLQETCLIQVTSVQPPLNFVNIVRYAIGCRELNNLY